MKISYWPFDTNEIVFLKNIFRIEKIFRWPHLNGSSYDIIRLFMSFKIHY